MRKHDSFGIILAFFSYIFIVMLLFYAAVGMISAAEKYNLLLIGANINAPILIGVVACLFFFVILFIQLIFPSLHLNVFDFKFSLMAKYAFIALVILVAMITAIYFGGLKEIAGNLEGLLLVIGATVSIAGLFFSGYSIRVYRRQITSFGEFSRRLKSMVEETSGDDSDDYTRIMAYTPIPGSLALNNKDYHALRDSITNRTARIEVICLTQENLSSWFYKFSGRRYQYGKLEEEKIRKSISDVEDLIKNIDEPFSGEKESFAAAHKVLRLRAEELPDFYLFFNDSRAIIAAPFFIPGVGKGSDIVSSEETPKFSAEPIEIIGFETTDRKVISSVRKYYESVREKYSGQLRETRPEQ
uniref:Uncharacterized protein n=1 Tax=Candidatus Kentrum sp. SD TaxID=2126332 RepID=A0A450Z744_9GAMM|nr:MAG: hypothetical protein BECKSD772F_GA0070984_11903 [Candidatus Kentron sp. SD]VFK49613.1 MAG: hypothetical protein BECKSD772E_GA0070983_12022 [Candidatus Kentron sp. SD]VFK78679.1 MAG: hypothetical protein BECKSD772D_GA0070982_102133 [Candidatus Kentron sp. SD]